MITLLAKPEKGAVYKFVYNKLPRVALVLNDDGRKMECYDFNRQGYRNFYHNKIDGNVQDVGSLVHVKGEPLQRDIDNAINAGDRVFHDEREDVLYIVNIK